VVVGLAGVGSYFSFNKPAAPYLVTSTSSGTTVTSGTQTTSSETGSATVVPVEWVTVGQVRSIDYYLSLLESNGTAPYVQLASELRNLPDMQNATAVAQITYLALNATNPEVKEAFQLMKNGGTPSQSDYSYPVPTYNTELEILYWLACQNAFKKDDTLALAIAMSNGIWVSMGTSQVRLQVRKDTSDLLVFYRETNMLQEQRGYPQLENYPLEAKIGLGWTGSLSMHWMGDRTQLKYPASLVFWKEEQLPPMVYEKDTVSVETLRKMRDLAIARDWWQKDVNLSIGTIEEYFYFTPGNWQYATFPNIVDSQGIDSTLDVDWQFNRYLNGSIPLGDCGTETAWMDAWAKAIGVATLMTFRYRLVSDPASYMSHHYILYFDPARYVWTAYEQQIYTLGSGTSEPGWMIRYFIFRPPVNQKAYTDYTNTWSNQGNDLSYASAAYCFKQISLGQTEEMMTKGFDTAQMKQWLFYS
jgi:hypothetical protein